MRYSGNLLRLFGRQRLAPAPADLGQRLHDADAAFSTKVAGDMFYVAHDHAESAAAAITLTSAGTSPTQAR